MVRRCMWLLLAAGAVLNLMVLAAWLNPDLRPSFLVGEDNLRWRLLRLACVASLALPTLTLFHERLSASREPGIGRTAFAIGALAMPTILVLAGLSSLSWKYLLPLPAVAVWLGSLLALADARRRGNWLERGGWWLVIGSISAGLLMGLYAFDGPLPAPALLREYDDLPRRVMRDTHALTIVVGMLALAFAARAPRPR